MTGFGDFECGESSVCATFRLFHRNDFLFDIHNMPYIVEKKRMIKRHLSKCNLKIKSFMYY